MTETSLLSQGNLFLRQHKQFRKLSMGISKNQDREKTDKLAKYLEEFQNFCFDLDINNVLNGSINFKFR